MKSQESLILERPFGSWLLGDGTEDGGRIRVRVRWLLAGSLLIANTVGAALAIILITVVMPGPPVFTRGLAMINFIAVPLYIGASWLLVTLWVVLRGLRVLRWATEGAELDAKQSRATLRLPAEFTMAQGTVWLGGLVLFSVLYTFVHPDVVPKVAFSIVLSALVTCASAYLLSEFSLRPIAARALVTGPPRRRLFVGVTIRSLGFWAIGSATPVAGLMLVAVTSFFRDEVNKTQLAITALALGAVSLVFGFFLTYMTTRATTAPIRTVRAALAKVERGDFDAEIVVFDGTELGQLQASVNHMVAGLRERERVKDLFGRHVGSDVAEAAMSSHAEVELGGEVRDVAVLFVDVVGSTRIAATRPPTEVVEVLNRFFSVVVDEVHAHEGFVNKFQGDAALAIFGAPADLADAPGRALAAARSMIERLEEEIPEFSAGIGVSAGPAVAGNVGAEARFEYTVIGDPVNEAARLTELAKTVPGHVAVSMTAVERAVKGEQAHWYEYKKVSLRGRLVRTRVGIRKAL